MFICPGCAEWHTGLHGLPIDGDSNGKPMWTWDGNLEAPTLSPSILTDSYWGPEHIHRVCHSFLVAGVFQFLGDSTHSLANQHVPIPDLPDWVIHA